ncbi:MAG TPA: DUF4055 domain-containing protein [Candidatus Limnocylindria bacterium]|nr:DUF4055 domain-containing protein [Candidatus Limnocylindria bacterium]
MADTQDLPSTPHPDYERMADRWRRCRDLAEGTDAIHKAGERYLPRHPKERVEDYDRRALATEVYNAFARTVLAMTGLVCHRPPTLGDDVPAVIRDDHWLDIDGNGTSGEVFAQRLFDDGMTVGFAGILIDYPAVDDPEAISVAEEEALHLRPYWVAVRAEDRISWRFTREGSKTFLSQLVLRETVEEPDGLFKVRMVTRYRVFRRVVGFDENGVRVARVTWEIWAPKTTEQGSTLVIESSGTIAKRQTIPFVAMPIGKKPPLLDLADINLSHYRVSADRRWLMHLACVPIPVRKGYTGPKGEEMAVGPALLQDLPKEGSFEWAEVSGSAFVPTGEELKQMELRMASLGLAFLQSETRAAETAEAKRLDSAAQNASLATAAQALETALRQALQIHAEYLGLESGGTVTVNREFEQTVMSPDVIAALSALETAGQLSLETLLAVLKAGNVLGEEIDVHEEMRRILKAAADLADARERAEPNPGDPNQPPPKGGEPGEQLPVAA